MKSILAFCLLVFLAACGFLNDPSDQTSSACGSSSSAGPVSSSVWDNPIIDPSTVVRDSFVDARDGKVYPTVQIGRQVWMAKNLDLRFDFYMWDSLSRSMDAFSCPIDSLVACDRWGALYLNEVALGYFPYCPTQQDCPDLDVKLFNIWGEGGFYYDNLSETEKRRGLCPTGWQIPDSNDFLELMNSIGGMQKMYRLRDSLSWPDFLKRGTDEYGFHWVDVGQSWRGRGRPLKRTLDSLPSDHQTITIGRGFWMHAPERYYGYPLFYAAGIISLFSDVKQPLRCIKED